MHNSGTDLSLDREMLEVREGTLHRCGAPLGGARGDVAKRLEELETESCRPKRLSTSAKLDGAMLTQALRGDDGGRRLQASASSLETEGLRMRREFKRERATVHRRDSCPP